MHFPSTFSFDPVFHFALRWTPRAIIAGLAGYYSLGFAYEMGIMATIDRIAIRIFRHTMGYIGMGAMMPTFQWYSAWSVRLIAALVAGMLCQLVERICLSIYTLFFPTKEEPREKKSDR